MHTNCAFVGLPVAPGPPLWPLDPHGRGPWAPAFLRPWSFLIAPGPSLWPLGFHGRGPWATLQPGPPRAPAASPSPQRREQEPTPRIQSHISKFLGIGFRRCVWFAYQRFPSCDWKRPIQRMRPRTLFDFSTEINACGITSYFKFLVGIRLIKTLLVV
jgi:hypothetical protein